jgi:hypothetical protein
MPDPTEPLDGPTPLDRALPEPPADGDVDVDVDPRLHPAAAMSVLGHLIDLTERGLVTAESTHLTVRTPFRLSKQTA